jgi:hypothetical protein
MELENIILSEVSQAQKTKNHMFTLICRLYNKGNNVVGVGSHPKGRVHTGGMGIGKNHRT